MAIDHRQPRDGRIIEELGSYDPMVKNTDERVKLVPDRIKYWMSVGAKPSDNVDSPAEEVHGQVRAEGGGGTGRRADADAGAGRPDGVTPPSPRYSGERGCG